MLGEKVQYLAYPYGRFNERVLSTARAAGYEAAFSTQPGFNRHGVDPYRIHRLDIFGTDTATMLVRKLCFGSNDGSWRQTARYYGGRIADKLGF
jgi:peptidoglycan/xylan/chitin deacetylase (PgdA/CDA1 family)